jgi:hypothetical protein
VNEDVENKANDKVGDLLIYDNLEENDTSARIEQELQADVGVSENVELDQVHWANNADSHANTDHRRKDLKGVVCRPLSSSSSSSVVRTY